MSYDQVKAELDRGTPAELLCATCPWDRLCVEPPQMSSQDVQRHIDGAVRKASQQDPESGSPLTGLLATMIFSGKDSVGRLCPVFTLRLQGPDGRQIADGLRQQMRTWAEVPS